jgi:DNA-binding transcriptional LysR family regulator
VRALGESTAGEITVGAFPTLALRFMPGLLASLAEAHPGLVVHLEEGDQDEIVAGLQSGRLEAALSYGYALPEDIETVTLALLRPHAILPKTHAAAGRPMVTLAELSEEPFLLLDLPHSREYFLRLFAQEGVRPRITHRSRSSELLRGLVGRGRGFTLHNATPATPATYDGTEVAMVPLSGEREPTEVMLLVSRRVHRRAAVDAFLGHVREAFAALSLRA